MIFNLIRWPLGQLILLIDFLTAPRKPQRDPAEQAVIDDATRHLALYQFKACPFCVKTRRAMRRLGLNIETRDARNDPRWRSQLLAEGGRLQVPCLLIAGKDGDDQWLYESGDIIEYLEDQVRSIVPAAPDHA
ncbi:glutaredoxin family protein [Thiosocius teredinicola]|uniref:glutaredoxin family protein n=1 Tax=Thiosocius teredinicola TaxID=1973002 RepID=UPI0009911E8D